MLRKKLRATDGLEFGNSIYKVKFEQKDRCTTFGHKYVFNLEDAIDGCAEYVINMKVLKRFVALISSTTHALAASPKNWV